MVNPKLESQGKFDEYINKIYEEENLRLENFKDALCFLENHYREFILPKECLCMLKKVFLENLESWNEKIDDVNERLELLEFRILLHQYFENFTVLRKRKEKYATKKELLFVFFEKYLQFLKSHLDLLSHLKPEDFVIIRNLLCLAKSFYQEDERNLMGFNAALSILEDENFEALKLKYEKNQ